MPFVLLTGGATGADTLAARWAKEHNVPCEVYPANWQLHGRAAGFVRNVEMIKTGIDMLIAFPGGTGTAHMMIACLKHGIKVVKIEDEGEIGSSPVYFEESLK
jgi:predicted Rossmann-fold nucleotide-binding protein